MTNKRPIHIFLDDERRAPRGAIQTNTVEDTIELLKAFHAQGVCVASLSLDHDLGYTNDEGREMTGHDVILWIELQMFSSTYFPPKKIFSQSQNPVGRKRIEIGATNIKQTVANWPEYFSDETEGEVEGEVGSETESQT